MKKLLLIIMVLCMLFALGAMIGCQSEQAETPAGTETPAAGTETPAAGTETPAAGTEAPPAEEVIDQATLEASLPNEYIQEKLAAGMEVTFAFCTPSLSSELMVQLDTGLKAAFEGEGITYISSAFNADSAVQIQQMENYVTMGVAAIMTIVFDEGFMDTANMVMDAGIHLIYWSSLPSYPISLSLASDHALLGQKVGDLVSAWVDIQYPNAGPGEVHAACFNNDSNTTMIMRNEAAEAAALANPKIDLVHKITTAPTDTTIDVGFRLAEEALTYDPTIKVFWCQNTGLMIGVCNYLESQNISDFSEYGCFGGDANPTAAEMIDAAKADPSANAMRGYVTTGLANVWEWPFTNILKLMYGEIEPGSVAPDPVWTYDSIGMDYNQADEMA